MSINFAAYPTQGYIGTVFQIPMQIAGKGAYVVPLFFDWLIYGASSTNQDLSVSVDLAGGGVRPVTLDQIRSVYIDNANSPVPIYIDFPDTGFAASAQPFSSGWYPVFTNAKAMRVTGLGFVTGQIPQTRVFVSNVFAPPYTDTAFQAVLDQFIASPVIGGGSSISSIVPLIMGSCYANGALSISGGGGAGATAHGILDEWGQFQSVQVDTAGTHYSGSPIILPTAINPAPAAFDDSAAYTVGQHLTYQGTIWKWNGAQTILCGTQFWTNALHFVAGDQCNVANLIYVATIANNNVWPPSNSVVWRLVGSREPLTTFGWVNSNVAPAVTAQFSTLLSTQASAIVTRGYGVPALGDQAEGVIDTVTGLGIFRTNLWGTPYVEGFIYLTNLFVQTSTGDFDWRLENSNGYSPFTFTAGALKINMDLQCMNMKLDATLTWRLECIRYVGTGSVSHGWAWTYSTK